MLKPRHWATLAGLSPLVAIQVAGVVIGLATSVVWARLMAPHLFGEFRVVLGVVTFVSAFCLLGTGQAAMMSAAAGHDGNLAPLLRQKLAANVAVSLVLVACGVGHHRLGLSPTVGAALAGAAAIFTLYNVSDVWIGAFNGRGRFAWLAVGQIGMGLCGLVAVLISALAGLTSLVAISGLHIGLIGLLNAVLCITMLAQRTNTTRDATTVRYGHHNSVAMAFTAVLSLDVVALSYFHAPAEVASYAIALRLPDLAKKIFTVFNQYMAPTIYRASSFAEIWPLLRRPYLLFTAGTLLLALAGFFALPAVSWLLFSDVYAEAAQLGSWLWLATVATGSSAVLASALSATKKRAFAYLPNIGYPMLLAGLYAALVPYGASGLVWGRIIATLVLSAFYVGAFAYMTRRVLLQGEGR